MGKSYGENGRNTGSYVETSLFSIVTFRTEVEKLRLSVLLKYPSGDDMIKVARLSFIAVGLVLVVVATIGEAHAGEKKIQEKKAETQSSEAYIELVLTARNSNGEIVAQDKGISVYLHEGGEEGWDAYDSSKIIPSLTDQFVLLGFVGEKNGEETYKSQESRPYISDTVQVIQTRLVKSTDIGTGLEYTLSVDQWYNVPSDWSLRMHGPDIGETLVFDNPSSTHTFTLSGDNDKLSSSDTTQTDMSSEVGPTAPLPVELAEVSAQADGGQVLVQWQTSSETNNAGFVVEHRRGETETEASWSEMGFVQGAGTTTQPQSYQYRADNLGYGEHQFRLRQRDTDGTTTTSSIVSADLRLKVKYRVRSPYPNPTRGTATMEITVQEQQPVAVEVYDVQGRRIRTVHQRTLAGQQTRRVRVSTEGLSSSLYFVRVEGKDFTETRRLTVVK